MKTKQIKRYVSLFLGMMVMLSLGQVALADASSTASIGFVNAASPLTLDLVPSFTFGTSNTIPAQNTTYTADAGFGVLQVTDNRGLNALSTWTVTGKLGTFSPDAGVTTSLTGAKLSLSTGISAQVGGLGVNLPLASQLIEMTSGGSAATVLTTVGVLSVTGGVYKETWLPVGVTLSVLGGTASVGEHVATINWTISTN